MKHCVNPVRKLHCDELCPCFSTRLPQLHHLRGHQEVWWHATCDMWTNTESDTTLPSHTRHRELHNSISSRHRRDTTMSALLSAIVLVFFICHSTKIVTHTYEAYQVPAPSTQPGAVPGRCAQWLTAAFSDWCIFIVPSLRWEIK